MSGLRYIVFILFVTSSLVWADDTTAVDTTFLLDACNHIRKPAVGSGTNYGSVNPMLVGKKSGFLTDNCRPLMGVSNSSAIMGLVSGSDTSAVGDTCNTCVLKFHVAGETFDAGDSIYVRAIKQGSWTEAGSNWGTYDGSNSWGTAGCASSGTDYHAWWDTTIDANGTGWREIGCKEVGDSIIAGGGVGGYSFEGFVLTAKTEADNDTAAISSDDSAGTGFDPRIQITFDMVVAVSEPTPAGENLRHGPDGIGVRHSGDGVSVRHGPAEE